MSKVIQIRPPQPHLDGSELKGWATCQHCRNKWESTAPVGTVQLQCPRCGTAKGLFMYGHEGDPTLVCECLCHVFTISNDSVICWRCGKRQILPD